MLYLAIPFLIRTKELMDIWLKEYPTYAIAFSQLMILVFVIDSICGPLWMTIQATGKIRIYQTLTILLSILFLLGSYYLLKTGFMPIIILYNRILLSFCFLFLQYLYLRRLFDFSSMKFFKNLLLNLFIGIASFIVIYFICNYFTFFHYVITTFVLSTTIVTLMIFVFGLNSQEKGYVTLRMKQFLFRNK